MRNWLGQDVVPSSIVYRGARDGNTSSFKIGVVESVKDGKARVHWHYEPSWVWRYLPGNVRDSIENVPGRLDTKGSPSVDSLIVMSQEVLDRLDQACYLVKRWQDDATMSNADLRQMLDNLVPV